MPQRKQVCILSPCGADRHRATGQANCRNHRHCQVETASRLVESGEANWTNRGRTGIRMRSLVEWKPRMSAGYLVLQLV